jgi:hypothetical protein
MHSFPFDPVLIPKNGIYVLFETGEKAHGTRRIVRIGTHTGANQLRSRLAQHFLNPNKDRSIFRKNIGRALLNRDADPFLADWNLDLTTRAARLLHAGRVDEAKQESTEERVTEYIRSRFQFVVLPVQDLAQRLLWESRIVSTVSLCRECNASPHWLGRDSPVEKIAKSGLWQVNELWKDPFTTPELREFIEIATRVAR